MYWVFGDRSTVRQNHHSLSQSRSVYDDASNPKSLLSEKEKARRLVTGIRNKVKLNPTSSCKDRGMYGDIADILNKKKESKFTLKLKIIFYTSERQVVECVLLIVTQTLYPTAMQGKSLVSAYNYLGFHGNCTSWVLLLWLIAIQLCYVTRIPYCTSSLSVISLGISNVIYM